MLVCIGAVLSGGIFGDHCSPISDSTILASTGAGSDHIDHVKTQIPYAVTNGIIVLVMFIVAGITASPYTVLVGIIIMIATFITIARITHRRELAEKTAAKTDATADEVTAS